MPQNLKFRSSIQNTKSSRAITKLDGSCIFPELCRKTLPKLITLASIVKLAMYKEDYLLPFSFNMLANILKAYKVMITDNRQGKYKNQKR